jgi:hypothetical protein
VIEGFRKQPGKRQDSPPQKEKLDQQAYVLVENLGRLIADCENMPSLPEHS